MSNEWKPDPNSLAAVRVKDVGLADWPTILAADGRYSRIPPGFLMPLPAPSPEDHAWKKTVRDIYDLLIGDGAMTATDAVLGIIEANHREYFCAPAAAQSPAPSDLHTICDHPAKYDAGECCGREPCAEDARIAGLRDAFVAKAMEASKRRLEWNAAAGQTGSGEKFLVFTTARDAMWDACDAYRAAVSATVEPVQPVGEG